MVINQQWKKAAANQKVAFSLGKGKREKGVKEFNLKG